MGYSDGLHFKWTSMELLSNFKFLKPGWNKNPKLLQTSLDQLSTNSTKLIELNVKWMLERDLQNKKKSDWEYSDRRNRMDIIENLLISLKKEGKGIIT